jgi:hypothetical protein
MQTQWDPGASHLHMQGDQGPRLGMNLCLLVQGQGPAASGLRVVIGQHQTYYET